MCRISVIICSLNPRPDYFRRVLDSLKRQTLCRESWELILVDNASHQSLAETCDLTWHPHHIHVREEMPGLTPARLRGLATASGELLVFFDDDNIVSFDYLEQALEIRDTHPFLGVFGAGIIEPEFETEPRSQVRSLLPYLALRTVDAGIWTNNPKDVHCLPWGAGLCVTRPTAAAYVQLVGHIGIGHLLDRRGPHLFAGGDDLFSWVSARGGSGFGIFPALRITHLVRAGRVETPYLLRLVHDHAYSHRILGYVLRGEGPGPSPLENAVRIVLTGIRRGLFLMRCRWAAARGSYRAERDIVTQSLHTIDGIDLRGHDHLTGLTS
jgi:glycosyltransferase involved in cell wall biosynthesis